MYQLIVSQSFEKVQAGVLYNDTLMEYYEFSENDREILGDIRLGQVREVVPGINAVFMNVGENRPGFMPVDKGRISDYKPGQEFLVQQNLRLPSPLPKTPSPRIPFPPATPLSFSQ